MFRNPNESCELCVQNNRHCGPKQIPIETKKLRNDVEERKELYEDLKAFADERLRRGQSPDDIRAIMNPDGEIEPVELEIQPLENYHNGDFAYPPTASTEFDSFQYFASGNLQVLPNSNFFGDPMQPTSPQATTSSWSQNIQAIDNNNSYDFASYHEKDQSQAYSQPSATITLSNSHDYITGDFDGRDHWISND